MTQPLTLEQIDKANLIREAYAIEGIGDPECRSIFMDWAMQLPAGLDEKAALQVLLDTYGAAGHPMTAILTEGLGAPDRERRRGGARARRGHAG